MWLPIQEYICACEKSDPDQQHSGDDPRSLLGLTTFDSAWLKERDNFLGNKPILHDKECMCDQITEPEHIYADNSEFPKD